MKEKLKKYIKEIITFLIFVMIISNVISLYKSRNLNKEALVQVNLTLITSKKYKFTDDKPILIHYWATWCPICKVEAQNIQKISKYYNVLTIAVKSGSNNDIQRYMNENELNFNVYNDDNGFFAQKSKIAVYPTTFIYDKNKNLLFSEVGYTSTVGLWIRMWWAGL